MKKLYLVLALFLIAIPCYAIATYTGFTTRATGYVVQASDWNNEFGNFIAHYNTNVIGTLNLLSAKGYLLSFDGTNYAAITNAGAADNNKVLQFDSTTTPGWKLSAIANTTALTTKGDLLGYAANLARIPVGTDGQVLTSRASNANGVAWESGGIPTGGILMWSGSIAAIPSGYHLCDGTSGTPNLQGLFIVGAGNVSPAATGGMGLVSPGGPSGDNSAGAGLGPTHVHSLSLSTPAVFAATGGTPAAQSGSAIGVTVTPKYYALALIQKT